MKFYVTFSSGCTLARNFAEVQADDYNELHKYLHEQYPKQWMFTFTEAVWNENRIAEKEGLTEVKFGTECTAIAICSENNNEPPPGASFNMPGDPLDETDSLRLEDAAVADCSNRYDVRLLASGQRIMIGRIPIDLTREDAMVLAAWLLVNTNRLPGHGEFGEIIEAVERLDNADT